jgi:hypothetical protein
MTDHLQAMAAAASRIDRSRSTMAGLRLRSTCTIAVSAQLPRLSIARSVGAAQPAYWRMGPLWAPCRLSGIVSKRRAAWAERKLVGVSRGMTQPQCADCDAFRKHSTSGPLFGPRNASSAMRNPCRVRVPRGWTPARDLGPLRGAPCRGTGSLLRKSGPCPQHGDRVLPSK